MKKIILLMACCAVAVSSCIKDNGNYDYKDINVVTINVDERNVLTLESTTFRLDPQITQSKQEDNSNLEYAWKYSAVGFPAAAASKDTVSTAQFIDIVVDPTTTVNFEHYYRLLVTDKSTGVTYGANTMVKIIKPFDGAWMILQDDGGVKLSGIEFREGGLTELVDDVFQANGRAKPAGNPKGIGIYYDLNLFMLPYYPSGAAGRKNLFFLVTDDKEGAGQYIQSRGFDLTRKISDMPQNTSLITNEQLSKYQMIHGNNGAISCVLDGKLYSGRHGLKFYEAQIEADLTTDGPAPYFSLAHKVGWMTILYDNAGRRILSYNNNSNGNADASGDLRYWMPELYAAKENTVKVQNVNRPAVGVAAVINPIPVDREVVYLGPGPTSGASNNERNTRPLALARGVEGNTKSYAYQFIAAYSMFGTTSQIDNVFEFNTPSTMTEASVYVSTVTFNGLMFYATGNTLYRLDYTTGKSTPIYVHEGGGRITMMKFARYDINSYDYEFYGVNVNLSLGIVVEKSASLSDFVVVNLSEAGLVSGDSQIRPATQVFSGFGDVVDILFL